MWTRWTELRPSCLEERPITESSILLFLANSLFKYLVLRFCFKRSSVFYFYYLFAFIYLLSKYSPVRFSGKIKVKAIPMQAGGSCLVNGELTPEQEAYKVPRSNKSILFINLQSFHASKTWNPYLFLSVCGSVVLLSSPHASAHWAATTLASMSVAFHELWVLHDFYSWWLALHLCCS